MLSCFNILMFSTQNVDLAQFGVKDGMTLLLAFRKRAQT